MTIFIGTSLLLCLLAIGRLLTKPISGASTALKATDLVQLRCFESVAELHAESRITL
jgi:hypothetical protein